MTDLSRVSAFLLAIIVLGLGGQPAWSQPVPASYDWRVVSRFRLWTAADARTPGSTDALLDRLAVTNIAPTAFHDEVVGFLRHHPDLHRRAFWNATAEQYDLDYVYASQYRVRLALGQAAAPGAVCRWSTTQGRFDQDEDLCANGAFLTLEADATGDGSVPARVQTFVDGSAAAFAAEDIRVRDRLFVSVGDSFASGEGNPDIPTSGWPTGRTVGLMEQAWENDRWIGQVGATGPLRGASWWDQRCHRSFYSQHAVAALKYAADHPREAVTFLSYACSGAEVFKGVVAVQARPPGYSDSGDLTEQRLPQLDALTMNLCRADSQGRTTARNRGKREPPFSAVLVAADGTVRGTGYNAHRYECEDARPTRTLDAILLSVGGNDVGFGPVIFDSMFPRYAGEGLGRRVLGAMRERLGRMPGWAYAYVVEALPQALESLAGRLDEYPRTTPIIQSAYPMPSRDERGQFCGPARERTAEGLAHPHNRRLAALRGIWPDANVPVERRWIGSISTAESRAAEDLLVDPLNRAVADIARQSGGRWTVTDGFLRAFANRGWCAASTSPDDRTDLPVPAPGTGIFDWSPSEWDPYVTRQRLFRTPNDISLTQTPANPRRRLGWFSWVAEKHISQRQEGLIASFAGSFHPTYEAHVIIGLDVARSLDARVRSAD